MEAHRSRARWTYAEFARLPSEGSARYEVVDGNLAVTPAPTPRHQIVVTELARVLANFVRPRRLGHVLVGPVDVLFGEGDYFEPDLVFVSADRSSIMSARGIEGAPDLIVEVTSPSSAHRDHGIKLERYRHFGVPEYWIVDVDARTVEVWRLRDGASSAEIVGADAHIRWAPGAGGDTLQISVGDVLSDG